MLLASFPSFQPIESMTQSSNSITCSYAVCHLWESRMIIQPRAFATALSTHKSRRGHIRSGSANKHGRHNRDHNTHNASNFGTHINARSHQSHRCPKYQQPANTGATITSAKSSRQPKGQRWLQLPLPLHQAQLRRSSFVLLVDDVFIGLEKVDSMKTQHWRYGSHSERCRRILESNETVDWQIAAPVSMYVFCMTK